METVEGYVESIIYRSEENGYTVFSLRTSEGEVVCAGDAPSFREGEYLRAEGDYVNHPVYGPQLKPVRIEFVEPSDNESIRIYLSSGAVKGIKETLALRIVDKFGEDSLKVMETNPAKLSEVKGISLAKAREISAFMRETRRQRAAVMFLQKYGLGPELSGRVFDIYGDEVYEIIRNDPYRLAKEVRGIGFRRADEIAAISGIGTDSEFRIVSGILNVLYEAAAMSGDTCLDRDEVTRRAVGLLELDADLIEDKYMSMSIEGDIVVKGEKIYSSPFYYMECHIAEILGDLCESFEVSEPDVEKVLNKTSSDMGIELDELQKKAILEAAGNGVFILTGGPGTGKTTVINTMIRYFEGQGLQLELAAPTGRAAKRMSELTGRDAKTIHRLLGFSGGDLDDSTSPKAFTYCEDNPLEADVIIIDEASMIDTSLMYHLLLAVPEDGRIIFSGDADQLPSVGAGSVLKDIIASERFPVLELTNIFRQAALSDIVTNAHRIREGNCADIRINNNDFFFIPCENADETAKKTVELASSRIPRFLKTDPGQIQVLTPTKKGRLGVESLNALLQESLNPPSPDKKEKEYSGITFREGDKIMQSRNDYELEWEIRDKYGVAIEKGKGVFNGDMGTIISINDFDSIVTVEFEEGKIVEYPYKSLSQMDMAYAVTVHKSQGSEYPGIILPLYEMAGVLKNRNLLYTAVTRARDCVVVVGSWQVFCQMTQNGLIADRSTGLCERIREMTG